MSKKEDEVGKMFIGGLSWETTKEELHAYFSKYGELTDCVIMKHPETGVSRGFGFVTFKDSSCVDVVLASNPHVLNRRTIDPKPCNPRNAPRRPRGKGFPKVFLGGLPPSVTETELRKYFSRYGKVLHVAIMYNHEKNKSRGFGFVSFETEEICNTVVDDRFATFGGKQIEMKRANPKDTASAAAAAYSREGGWNLAQQILTSPTLAPQLATDGVSGVYQGLWMPSYGAGYQGWAAPTVAGYGAYGQYPQQAYPSYAQYPYGWGTTATAATIGPAGDGTTTQTAADGTSVAYTSTYVGYTAPVQEYAALTDTTRSTNNGEAGSFGVAKSTTTAGQSQSYHPYRRQ